MRHPKAVLAVIATTALATSCGTVEQYSKLRTPTDRTLHAGVGQAVFPESTRRGTCPTSGVRPIFMGRRSMPATRSFATWAWPTRAA